MNKYEVMYIVNDSIEEAAKKALVERFMTLVADNGGQVLKTDVWGHRRLAYPIRDMFEGYYVLMTFEAPAEAIAEIERNFRISAEYVLRFMTTRLPDDMVIRMDTVEPEEPAETEEASGEADVAPAAVEATEPVATEPEAPAAE